MKVAVIDWVSQTTHLLCQLLYHWWFSLCCFPTERGVCLPTVSLWILFVYIEAAIRFKDLKNFHVDLCRPFAAHWWVLPLFLVSVSVVVSSAEPHISIACWWRVWAFSEMESQLWPNSCAAEPVIVSKHQLPNLCLEVMGKRCSVSSV